MGHWIKGRAYRTQVIHVRDGDTIVVAHDSEDGRVCDRWPIRLAGMDAPERTQPPTRPGEEAYQNLCHLCLLRKVTVIPTRTWPDPYGRTIARVFRDGQDLSTAQIRANHAIEIITAGGRLRRRIQHPPPTHHKGTQTDLSHTNPHTQARTDDNNPRGQDLII